MAQYRKKSAQEKGEEVRSTLRQKTIDSIKHLISQSNQEWRQSWSNSNIKMHNPVSGTVYAQTNRLILFIESQLKGQKDPRWITWKQATEQGLAIRRGAKAATIASWNKTTKQNVNKLDEYGMPILDENGKPIQEVVELPIRSLTTHSVFNGEDVVGMKPFVPPEYTPQQITENQKIAYAKADAIIADWSKANNIEIIEYPQENAYFRNDLDRPVVALPWRNQFESQDAFYATAFHELAHSTGVDKKIRTKDEVSEMPLVFGNRRYAREELTAELTSLYLSQAIGIDTTKNELGKQSIAYIKGWVEQGKLTDKDLYVASIDAFKASNALLKYEPQLTLEQVLSEQMDNQQEMKAEAKNAPQAQAAETVEQAVTVEQTQTAQSLTAAKMYETASEIMANAGWTDNPLIGGRIKAMKKEDAFFVFNDLDIVAILGGKNLDVIRMQPTDTVADVVKKVEDLTEVVDHILKHDYLRHETQLGILKDEIRNGRFEFINDYDKEQIENAKEYSLEALPNNTLIANVRMLLEEHEEHNQYRKFTLEDFENNDTPPEYLYDMLLVLARRNKESEGVINAIEQERKTTIELYETFYLKQKNIEAEKAKQKMEEKVVDVVEAYIPQVEATPAKNVEVKTPADYKTLADYAFNEILKQGTVSIIKGEEVITVPRVFNLITRHHFQMEHQSIEGLNAAEINKKLNQAMGIVDENVKNVLQATEFFPKEYNSIVFSDNSVLHQYKPLHGDTPQYAIGQFNIEDKMFEKTQRLRQGGYTYGDMQTVRDTMPHINLRFYDKALLSDFHSRVAIAKAEQQFLSGAEIVALHFNGSAKGSSHGVGYHPTAEEAAHAIAVNKDRLATLFPPKVLAAHWIMRDNTPEDERDLNKNYEPLIFSDGSALTRFGVFGDWNGDRFNEEVAALEKVKAIQNLPYEKPIKIHELEIQYARKRGEKELYEQLQQKTEQVIEEYRKIDPAYDSRLKLAEEKARKEEELAKEIEFKRLREQVKLNERCLAEKFAEIHYTSGKKLNQFDEAYYHSLNVKDFTPSAFNEGAPAITNKTNFSQTMDEKTNVDPNTEKIELVDVYVLRDNSVLMANKDGTGYGIIHPKFTDGLKRLEDGTVDFSYTDFLKMLANAKNYAVKLIKNEELTQEAEHTQENRAEPVKPAQEQATNDEVVTQEADVEVKAYIAFNKQTGELLSLGQTVEHAKITGKVSHIMSSTQEFVETHNVDFKPIVLPVDRIMFPSKWLAANDTLQELVEQDRLYREEIEVIQNGLSQAELVLDSIKDGKKPTPSEAKSMLVALDSDYSHYREPTYAQGKKEILSFADGSQLDMRGQTMIAEPNIEERLEKVAKERVHNYAEVLNPSYKEWRNYVNDLYKENEAELKKAETLKMK